MTASGRVRSLNLQARTAGRNTELTLRSEEGMPGREFHKLAKEVARRMHGSIMEIDQYHAVVKVARRKAGKALAQLQRITREFFRQLDHRIYRQSPARKRPSTRSRLSAHYGVMRA